MANTLREYHKLFIESLRKKQKASSTLLAYGKDVEQLVDALEQEHIVEPAQVTHHHIEQFAQGLKEKRYTAKSIVRKINSAKAFFLFLREEGVVEKNPAVMVTRPRYENAAPRILSKMEYRALRDVCRADKRVYAIVELLLQTGIRISELACLTLESVNLPQKTLTVCTPETNAVRTIPLNNAAVRALQDYIEIRPKTREKVLFVTKSCRPFLVRNVRASIDRYFKLAGIENAKVNDIRHTFIVEQLSLGVPLIHVSHLVGHARVTTTEKYLRFLEKRMDVASLKIEEL